MRNKYTIIVGYFNVHFLETDLKWPHLVRCYKYQA